MQELYELGALKVLSIQESRKTVVDSPKHVLPSRFVERGKPADDGGVEAESRFVVFGWKDPEVRKLVRSAPTPTPEGMAAVYQWIAGMKLDGSSSDLTNAFGQALPTTRKQRIAVPQPAGGLPGLHPEQLLRCETEVYVLVTGQMWLRSTLKQEFLEKGYVQNPYDRCIYSLHGDHTW